MVTSAPRPARALPAEDEEPDVGVLPATPTVRDAPIVDTPPIEDAASVPSTEPEPASSPAVPADVESVPSPDADEYVEPPILSRPYAVATPAYAPGPPAYVPPASTFSSSEPHLSGAPFQTYTSPVPTPTTPGNGETGTPNGAPVQDDPPVSNRPYAQPGVVAHVPPPVHASAPILDPTASFGGPPVPAPLTGFGSARPRTENVGRGLLMALIAVVGGCVFSAVVYHLGYVASIVALAMGGAGIFLYAKGAGSPPRKGAVSLVVLLAAGIVLAWVTSIATELYLYYVDQTGTSDGALSFAVAGALSFDLFKETIKDFLIFVGFGALGIFGVARQLLQPRKT